MAVSSETSLAICFHFFTAASTMRLYYAQVLCISRRLGARTPHQRPRRGGRSSGCPAVRSSVLGSRARTDVDKQQQVEWRHPSRTAGLATAHWPAGVLPCWSVPAILPGRRQRPCTSTSEQTGVQQYHHTPTMHRRIRHSLQSRSPSRCPHGRSHQLPVAYCVCCCCCVGLGMMDA